MKADINFLPTFKIIHEVGRWRLVLSDEGNPQRFETYAFNENGWLVNWYRAGQTYSCGLDGKGRCTRYAVSGKHRFLRSRELSVSELEAEIGRLRDILELWRNSEAFCTLPVELLASSPSELRERFAAIWGRVAILPPDQYASAVVQLTQGCAYNNCEFCSFYKGIPYRVHEMGEFSAHLGQVAEFFGSELGERKGIFLADANAANVSDTVLLEALQVLASKAESSAGWDRCWRGGVASFLDTFSRQGRTTEQWRALREAGLRGLYLGVESGSASLRKLWRKPGGLEDIRTLVQRLKAAGLEVGIIVISGAEASFLENNHNEETLTLLNSLPLEANDKIYISEYQPVRDWDSDEEYVAYRAQCRRYTREMMEGLCFEPYPHGPVVSLYDVWQFVYI